MQGVPLFSVEHDIARITLNRPDQHNRIDPDDLPLLAQYVAAAERSGRVRALVITGAGSQTFSSGYTLSAIAEKLDRGFELFLDALENCALPTLCALNRFALLSRRHAPLHYGLGPRECETPVPHRHDARRGRDAENRFFDRSRCAA